MVRAMSDTLVLSRGSAQPRRRDAQATRAAILEAAQAQFARLGYDLASLREISAAAGVDGALIKRYFGGKEGLFTEALKAFLQPDRIRSWSRSSFAAEIAEMMASDTHASEERTRTFQFLLRAATSPTTAPLLNVLVQDRFMGPIRDWIGGGDVEARARLLASVFIGLLVERLIRDEPLTGQERDVFIERTAAMLQSLVDH